jgi:LysM repeat protein
MFLLSGCLIRTYTIEKPRVDLEIRGNQGYLLGAPPSEARPNRLGDTRTISVTEIELGSHKPRERGVIKPPHTITEETARIKEPSEEIKGQPFLPPTSGEKKYTQYTIQNNDTLQKISYKFYKTTKKWRMLYEENKDVLKDPDRIKPGVTIKVPILE